MRLKTILKELDTIIELLKGDVKKKQRAVRKLIDLRNKVALKVQEEEEKEKNKNPKANELARWYYGLWNKKIPEGNFGRVVNVFKSLLEEFSIPEEEIKQLYIWWLNLKKEEVPKNLRAIYNIVLGEKETRSITDFKGKLRYIKGLKRELEEGDSKTWTSPEHERGTEYYQKLIERKLAEEEKLPFEEGDEIPF
ncbi:MAG TPA: hypothetical protein EYH58_00200 [Aquifex aeolicus]|nr:hypothetical protein [Aquifex aeolicus]